MVSLKYLNILFFIVCSPYKNTLIESAVKKYNPCFERDRMTLRCLQGKGYEGETQLTRTYHEANFERSEAYKEAYDQYQSIHDKKRGWICTPANKNCILLRLIVAQYKWKWDFGIQYKGDGLIRCFYIFLYVKLYYKENFRRERQNVFLIKLYWEEKEVAWAFNWLLRALIMWSSSKKENVDTLKIRHPRRVCGEKKSYENTQIFLFCQKIIHFGSI